MGGICQDKGHYYNLPYNPECKKIKNIINGSMTLDNSKGCKSIRDAQWLLNQDVCISTTCCNGAPGPLPTPQPCTAQVH